jgi:hypothetical protein
MKYILIISFFVLHGCTRKKEQVPQITAPSNDTISLARTAVSKIPVAEYSEKIKNPYNDWRFGVKAYETNETFKYLLRIEYETLNEADTITIPNVGMAPSVEIRKGETELSCIVGFKNKDGSFMPYKQVWIKGKQLRIKTIRYYARTLVRKK